MSDPKTHNAPKKTFQEECCGDSFELGQLHILNALNSHVAIIDREGNITMTNKSWDIFMIDNGGSTLTCGKNANYFEVCEKAVEDGEDFGLKAILGLHDVFDFERDSFSLKYPCQDNGNIQWYTLKAIPLDRNRSRLVLMHDNTTMSERKEQLFRETKEQYQRQFLNTTEGIFIAKPDGIILDANPAACEILGYTKHELLKLNRNVVAVDNEKLHKALAIRKKTGHFEGELTFRHKNGKELPVEVSSSVYKAYDDSLQTTIIFRDITERKEAEKEIRKFSLGLERSPNPTYITDTEGYFTYVNPAFTGFYGYTFEEVKDKTPRILKSGDKSETYYEEFWNTIKIGEKVQGEFNNKTKHGDVVTVQFSVNPIVDNNEITGFLAIQSDISELKQMEKQLLSSLDEKENLLHEVRKNQVMMEQLFKNSPVGISLIDNENCIVDINSKFSEIFGYTKKEIAGKEVDALLSPLKLHGEAEEITDSVFNGNSFQTETIRRTKSGKEIPVLVGGVPVQIDGKIVAVFAIYVDVSKQHYYQKKIENSLHEKEVLLQEVHHRVKNNLAVVSGMLQLQRFSADNPEVSKLLMDSEGRIHAMALIHEMLYQNESLSNIDFKAFTKELCSSIEKNNTRHEKNIQCSLKSDPVFMNVNQAVPAGLIMNEILSNAFQHAFNGRDEGSVNIGIKEGDGIIKITVSDDGVGFNPDQINLTNHSNSMGLTIIKTLIDQLKAEWSVRNENGTVIEFSFGKKTLSGSNSRLIDESDQENTYKKASA